jgi:hypothetical protein
MLSIAQIIQCMYPILDSSSPSAFPEETSVRYTSKYTVSGAVPGISFQCFQISRMMILGIPSNPVSLNSSLEVILLVMYYRSVPELSYFSTYLRRLVIQMRIQIQMDPH